MIMTKPKESGRLSSKYQQFTWSDELCRLFRVRAFLFFFPSRSDDDDEASLAIISYPCLPSMVNRKIRETLWFLFRVCTPFSIWRRRRRRRRRWPFFFFWWVPFFLSREHCLSTDDDDDESASGRVPDGKYMNHAFFVKLIMGKQTTRPGAPRGHYYFTNTQRSRPNGQSHGFILLCVRSASDSCHGMRSKLALYGLLASAGRDA